MLLYMVVFRESFEKNCNIENMIEIDRKGFEAWKNMSNEVSFHNKSSDCHVLVL